MKTKMIWTLVIVLCLCAFLLAGCKEKPEEPEPPIVHAEGSWTVSDEQVAPAIPDDAKQALDDATAELTDVGYEPLAYLGSQVVAGSNYGFLCRATTASAQPQTKLCTVKVYRDLAGNSSILESKDVAISSYTTDEVLSYAPDGLAGGWHIDPDLAPAALPEDVQSAFDKATVGLNGISYQPLAYLGSQVVAGTNFALLCNVNSVAEGASALAIVTIYENPDGDAQIISVAGLDFP